MNVSKILDPVRLWAGDAPGALGQNEEDIPTLTPYLPLNDEATRPAIVVCPGGGYGALAEHEGRDYALWLNAHGIAAFVLKYRLGSHRYRHPVMLQDATRAMRTVRARAEEWKIDRDRIGIMGSSAGGHLAATVLTHFDDGDATSTDPVEREGSRPDLGVLCYAVITMAQMTHGGSRQNLLGENPPEELIDLLSNERHVSPRTPPCFLWHTWEDKAVPIENSLQFAEALQRNRVPFDLHIYQQGGHGLGLAAKHPFEDAHPWSHDLVHWLKVQSFTGSDSAR